MFILRIFFLSRSHCTQSWQPTTPTICYRRGNCTYNRPFTKCIHYILLRHPFVFFYLHYGNNCSTSMDTSKIKFNSKGRKKKQHNVWKSRESTKDNKKTLKMRKMFKTIIYYVVVSCVACVRVVEQLSSHC